METVMCYFIIIFNWSVCVCGCVWECERGQTIIFKFILWICLIDGIWWTNWFLNQYIIYVVCVCVGWLVYSRDSLKRSLFYKVLDRVMLKFCYCNLMLPVLIHFALKTIKNSFWNNYWKQQQHMHWRQRQHSDCFMHLMLYIK